MNASLDGTLTLTKREKEILEKAPLLAAQIALHRKHVKESADALARDCTAVLRAANSPKLPE